MLRVVFYYYFKIYHCKVARSQVLVLYIEIQAFTSNFINIVDPKPPKFCLESIYPFAMI